jgi:antirestriction protein
MNEQHLSAERAAEVGTDVAHRRTEQAPDAAPAVDVTGDAPKVEVGETEPKRCPRLYVASLVDYNNGRLHGTWLDADPDPEVMQEAIDSMLSESPAQRTGEGIAEEWAIHDYQGFGSLRLGEYEALSTIARIAAGIDQHGPAFTAWAEHVGLSGAEQFNEFADRYQGEWESVDAFAENMLDEGGAQDIIDKAPSWLRSYLTLDVAGFARDLELSGDIVTAENPDGGVWVWSGM